MSNSLVDGTKKLALKFIAHLHRRGETPERLKIKIRNRIIPKYFGWRKNFCVEMNTSVSTRLRLRCDDFIQQTILLSGTWERNITNLIRRNLNDGDVFIDIGANIGYYTTLASQLVKENGRVYSIEASPSIYSELVKNVSLNNNHNNIYHYNLAVAAASGYVDIWKAGENNDGHTTIIESLAKKEHHLYESKVRCEQLGKIVPTDILLDAKIIKIDVEGAERIVLEGIRNDLRKFPPKTIWIIEISEEFLPNGRDDAEWIFDQFFKTGYSAYLIENSYDDSNIFDEVTTFTGPRKIDKYCAGKLADVIFTKQKIN